MTRPNPKLNAEGWDVIPAVSHKAKLPMRIEVPAGEFLMGMSKGRFVVRGGAWYYTRKLARFTAREGIMANHLSPSIGVRLTRSLR